jgi:hypothetical protein
VSEKYIRKETCGIAIKKRNKKVKEEEEVSFFEGR